MGTRSDRYGVLVVFQAEDGIRDYKVTGVQTCALPIFHCEMRGEMRAEMTKLHQRLEGTMICATDDSVEAMTLGDRIVVMSDGAVQQNDTPLVLYNQPANLFVAEFLGRPPMNFINGTLKQEGDKIRFCESEGGTIDVSFSASEHPATREFIG